MIYCYARVSVGGQSVDDQVKQLHAASAESICRKITSGVRADRAQLAHVLTPLNDGAVLSADDGTNSRLTR